MIDLKELKQVTKWALILELLLCLILFMSFVVPKIAKAEEYSPETLANAIFKAENSVKYPYGIKSIDTKGNAAYARKICLNSIRNAKKRWLSAGMPEDFIVFMGRRYSPPDINPNWVRLVKYFLKKGA